MNTKSNKIILIADTHFGENNNSEKTNNALLEFFEFVCEEGKKRGIDRLIILGDFFHQRDKLDVSTINYGLFGAEILAEHFEGLNSDRPDLIIGNHDIYYKYSKDINSANMLDAYLCVHEEPVVPMLNDECLFVPWVTDSSEWDRVIEMFKTQKPKFVFGHFEFNSFKMNDHYIMEHGYSHRALKDAHKVFTGHYHLRQEMGNVVYVGSPIPFNFNDANDTERGFCILNLDTGEHEFVNFEKVQVKSLNHKEFLDQEFTHPDYMSIRVEIDEEIDEETMDKVKEKLENGGFRNSKIRYTPTKYKELVESIETDDIESVDNIDEAVINYIQSADTIEGIDPDLMIRLYRQVTEMDDHTEMTG